MPLTAGEHLCAFFDAFADIRLHALVLLLRHHRSDGRLGISRIPDGKRAHGVAYPPFYVVEPTVGHEETRSRRTGLSAVQKGHEERRWNRLIERGIIEQNRGRFAAQFERDALHGRGTIAHDLLADAHRAGEGDLIDVRIAHELRATTPPRPITTLHTPLGSL